MEPYPAFFVEAARVRGVYDNTLDDASVIMAMLRARNARRVLDVPCGFGRIAGPLHTAGFDVVAVDASTEQLDLARRLNPGPEYLLGNMIEPPRGPFDVILNLYTSFGYMADARGDQLCLIRWNEVLRPGGLLVIETLDTARVAAIDESERHLQRDDGVFVRVTGPLTEYISTDWQTNIMSIDYRIGNQRFVSRTRLYHRDDLVTMLRDSGFSIVQVYSNLKCSPVMPLGSTVFFATK
jgi:SAM-dependent methyltransferase